MKYYFWILGCAMNYSDAERISALFDSFGFSETKNEKDADIIVVIACSVRQRAVDRIYGKVKEWKGKPNLTTILSGCVLEADREKLEKAFDFIFEVKEIGRLTEFLNYKLQITHLRPEATDGQAGQNLISQFKNDYLSIIPAYTSKIRAYVPISTGCNNFCTYCAVPYTRGQEKSRPMEDIAKEVKELVKNGFKEITLLGQNVNSYGNDLKNVILSKTKNLDSSAKPQNDNFAFIELIKEIDKIPGNYRVYFYSNHPKDMSEDLINTLSKLRHFPHYIHLPLQSGDDEIIKKMNRHYTQKDYLELVDKIRTVMPDIALTTDIIVGFPGETKEQFKETVKVMKKAKYDMAFIAQFSPRPGTKAAEIKDSVSKTGKKEREETLQKILAKTALEQNKRLIGKTEFVLIDEGKGDKFYGRTASYKVVEIKKSPVVKIGDFVKVKIIDVTAWKLSGELA